jgi:hypothetical protein
MGKKKQERVMLRRFTMALRDIWVASGEPGGAYRPDLHYMRGPGPKWHAKYGHLYPKAQPARGPATSTLGNIAEHHA